MNEFIFYVATDGNDVWSGKLPEPNGDRTDGPFATLTRARDTIRALTLSITKSQPSVTVMVRGGKYYLDQTFVLTKEDSGTPDCPITYRAYPDEKPVLSGGRQVTGWRFYRGEILQAELPGSKGGKWKFRQLFLNGRRMVRARWPKLDPADPLYSGWALTEGPAYEGSTDAFIYKPDTFPHRWTRPTEIEVIYWANIGGWCSMVPVKSIDEQKRVITLAHAGWQFDVPGWYMPVTFTKNNRFYVENELEDLTEPGEWCFDSEEGILYVWPAADGRCTAKDEQHLSVVVPLLDCLIDIHGASWVTISGFTFTETIDGDNFHHEGVEGTGAMYPRPGWRYCGDAVHLKGAEHCRIEDNRFDAVGGNAIYLEGYNARNIISGNEIGGAGANGICLLGTRLKHPIFNSISDNTIHHCGVINKYTAGVFSGMSDGNVISHNRFEHLPHHAINLSNSPFGRNFVEHNDIRWVDEEVADSTAINCWMEDPPDRDTQRCGHVIRFNSIADVYGCEVIDGKIGRSRNFPTSGIYLDNYTSNCFVYGNVIVRCTHAGILVHAGKNNLIENNVIIDCMASIRLQDYVSGMEYWKPMAGFMTGNHILRNISYQTGDRTFLFSLFAWTDRVVAQSDNNLFCQTHNAGYVLEYVDAQRAMTFAEWQRMGYDAHSTIADPLFVDPRHDDYRLKPESPAFTLGFQPIDMSLIGVRTGTT